MADEFKTIIVPLPEGVSVDGWITTRLSFDQSGEITATVEPCDPPDEEPEEEVKDAVVEIRRNADGVISIYRMDYFGDFIWSDGNYSCDCNRAIFFHEARKEDSSDRECGDSAFSVRILHPVSSAVLYEDADWATSPASTTPSPQGQ
jgi:hypothetical protein